MQHHHSTAYRPPGGDLLMGFKLYNEVFDHAPADLTPKEMIAALAFAEDANDGTRMIWKGIEDPHFLRRIRVKRARLYELVDGLVKKGVLDLVSAGHRHGRAKYRFARLATIQCPEDPDTSAEHPETPDTDAEFSVRSARTLNHDQCPEDPDVSVRKTRTPTTPNHSSKNTTQEQPPPPAAAAAPPDWVTPASGEGVVVQEEGEGKKQDARKRAEAFVEGLPFLNPPGRGRKQRLQAQVAAAIATGWSEASLMAVCAESLNSADDRVNCWLYRLKPAELGPAPKAGQDDSQSKSKVPKPRQPPDGHRTWSDPDPSAYRAPKGGHVGWQNPTDPNAYDGEF